MSTNAPNYSKIASGVIMRIGNYDPVVCPGRTQREVHPALRYVSITYKIEEDLYGLRTDAAGWEHYRYRFTYRYQGRTMSVSWRCGTAYGQPKGIDGLASAFMDDYGHDWETERKHAERIYNTCHRMAERLERFFADDSEREAWELALADR